MPAYLLKRSTELAPGTKRKFDSERNIVVAADVKMQFEDPAFFDNNHFLIKRLYISHAPMGKIELAPKSRVAGRRQRIVAMRIAKLLRQWLVVGNIEPLM